MKHHDSRAGLTRYDLRRNQDGIDLPTYPADPGKVHAVRDETQPRDWRARPGTRRRSIRTLRETDFEWEYTSECGATVRVLLPFPFDDGDPDVCRSCSTLMAARADSERAYREARSQLHKKQSEAARRRQEREDEREDVNAWMKEQNKRIVRQVFPGLDRP